MNTQQLAFSTLLSLIMLSAPTGVLYASCVASGPVLNCTDEPIFNEISPTTFSK